MGFTGHKKYRDYYPFVLTEYGLGIMIAMLIPILSFSDVIQNIAFILVGLLNVVTVILTPQFSIMKLMKIVMSVAFLILYIFALIVCLSQQVTTDAATTLVLIGKIILGFILCYNVIVLIMRLVNLYGDASSTYGENAKPIPPQKVKTRAPMAPSTGTA